jgi:hypothetical protein
MHAFTARVPDISVRLGRGCGYFVTLAAHRYTHAPMLTHKQSKLNPILHKIGSKYKLCCENHAKRVYCIIRVTESVTI